MRILVATPPTPYRLGWYCQRALEKLGHSVEIFDFDRKFFPPWKSQFKLNQRLIERVSQSQPDIIFVTKGKNILPETISAIRQKHKLIAMNWWPDDPYGFPFSKRIAPYYDYYFTNDSALINGYKKAGAKNVHFLPFACDPEIHRRIHLSDGERESLSSDICFVGQWNPIRQEVLENLTDFDLKVWGPGWKKKVGKRSKLRKKIFGTDSGPYGEDMIKIYSSAKIVLNIHLWFGENEDGINMRLFEATGCGAFLLSDWKKEIPELFDVGGEIACYSSVSDLRRSIEYYLNNDRKRQAIAEKGQERSYRDHTYLHRMEEALRIVGDG
ncbi:glycosyltransferase [candidate division NPL-UPA2 bacterium]|nr:glycosyltransferase [candidate division NPL-UPA2 bacterium]